MPHNLIKKALADLPQKTGKIEKKLLEQIGQFIPSDDVTHFNVNIIQELAKSHLDLSTERKTGEPKISIYCPIPEKGGKRKTIIDIVSDDMAFLVDSVAAEINRNNLLIDFLIHPFLYAKYDKNGKLLDVEEKQQEGYLRQSHIHVHIQDIVSEHDLKKLEKGLYQALEDVYIANRDWQKMLEKLKQAKIQLADSRNKVAKGELQQYCDFLQYLHDNNFTLLGYREYEFIEAKDGLKSKIVKGSSLGVLHSEVKPAYINETKESLPHNLQNLRRKLPPVSVSKTNRISTVHRRVPMDAIAIKIYDDLGHVVGEKLFLGLFTSVTYSRSVQDVPFLREKVENVIEMSGFLSGSHDRKALGHILEKYPRDELFQIAPKDLLKISVDILRLQERQRTALFMRNDPFGRYISCIIYVPRDRFGTALRKKMGEILEDDLNGKITSFSTSLDDSVFARVIFTVKIKQNNPPKYNTVTIEEKLQHAGQTWAERLSGALMTEYEDTTKVTDLTLKYGKAFPVAYTTNYRARNAVFDIRKIEAALQEQDLQVDLYRDPLETEDHTLKLKVYNLNEPLPLSDVLPILEHMGLKAISELPFEIKPEKTDTTVWIHDFKLKTPELENNINIADVKDVFEEAFKKIWCNKAESDALNKLVLKAQMDWRKVFILRTYVRYLKQIRFPFSRLYIEDSLTQNPILSGKIINLFEAKFDPEKNKSGATIKKASNAIITALEKVDSLDQDRILRTIRALIMASLRTNFYQTDKNGNPKTYLSIKFDCEMVPDLPQPAPFREIYVYSTKVEGLHLRGDKIARGGLRWSDRAEDYRTEVLGLMKAQMVKNSIIIPMGAKGGFVVKNPSNDRAAFKQQGIDCYKIFVRGLLDITDNREGDKIIPPENVVRHDEDDPYLVVAADKGTATFSDTANALSAEYNFWLGDAFASGGSAGYDHKEMGITAKGAWESVKLHFRQLNHNTQTTPFDVIGVGDMSGDVFGNGMILSEKIRLVGAFNHLHIFCDPDPNPETSFDERTRLFDNVMGWDQYNESYLSKGGKIFKRSDKNLKLTPEVMARFDIEDNEVSPPELMNAMLKARTDLLWFGGIGTYIKGSNETDIDVGDKSNDMIRVTGKNVRAKVIGEGANLAITQKGRIEFEQHGGKINTDFVDNSGGVDSSDHEVNIKILMRDVMGSKSHNMDIKKRNKLLEKMTDEIAAHVLYNNAQQALAISLAEYRAPNTLPNDAKFIEYLEKEKGLSRTLESLPNFELLKKRQKEGKGLTRPEICVLVSHSKIDLTQKLVASDIPDQPYALKWLLNYFPDELSKKFEKEIKRHRLHREIISTKIADAIVNRMGPAFIHSMIEHTGASFENVIESYLTVRDIFKVHEYYNKVEDLNYQTPTEVQLKALKDMQRLSKHGTIWLLSRLGRDLDVSKDTDNFKKGIKNLLKHWKDVQTDTLKQKVDERLRASAADKLPEDLAYQIASLPFLYSSFDIIKISLEEKADISTAARIFFEIGETFSLSWLRQQARFLRSDNAWTDEATSGMVDQLYACQAGLAVRILTDIKRQSIKTDGKMLDKWLAKNESVFDQVKPLFDELRRMGTIELPHLVIAEQRLRNLYGG